jgi:hypothetical protein
MHAQALVEQAVFIFIARNSYRMADPTEAKAVTAAASYSGAIHNSGHSFI